MKVFTEEFAIRTAGKGTYELTSEVRRRVREKGIQQGQVTVFLCHTSASLILMENADPSAMRDLERWFDRLVSEKDPDFTHTYEGSDDMPSHIRMVLTRSSEIIPIFQSELCLGTWQGLFLFEHRNAPHTRRVVLSILGV